MPCSGPQRDSGAQEIRSLALGSDISRADLRPAHCAGPCNEEGHTWKAEKARFSADQSVISSLRMAAESHRPGEDDHSS
ncbi:hypothetical protein SKAU_G00253740 [Synaphobranchus kaupii]|uniref:Uncharacterized protein n=1 Tax=Synaphobranchus kaupii TaxID=118154 RepID=A0A9Q1F3C8_SYNKA|nr:hypothetical protein SKAU_G00253740 [Synaphobranchus kaupii]